MRSKPQRLPDLVLGSPHDASPMFREDWTIVPGSRKDPEQWEQELKLRDARNRLIHESLLASRSVWYKSSGHSMWPLVQSGDACTFHPIQAVTADGRTGLLEKEESHIEVGGIVFCVVQRSGQYYAHIVTQIVEDYYTDVKKYWIGNIQQKCNGFCFREHIFGILVDVQVYADGQYHSRPHPTSLYERVKALVNADGEKSRWDSAARALCEPIWEPPLERHEQAGSSQ